MRNAEFYHLVELSPIFPVIPAEEMSDWILFDLPSVSLRASRAPIRGTILNSRRTQVFNCAVHPRHPTHWYYSDVELDLVGGAALYPFVYVDEITAINGDLAAALSRSDLTGLKVERARVAHQQTARRSPEVFYFQITAPRFWALPPIDPAFSNHCPFCGEGPVVCGTCGYFSFRCLECAQECMTSRSLHEGCNDRRLISDDAYNLAPGGWRAHLDVGRYSGTDFSGGPFPVITRKALDFLLDFGAMPFAVKPLDIN